MWFYLVVSLVTLIYIWQRRKFSYFKNRGIPEDPGYFPLGSWGTWQMFMGKVAFQNIADIVYKNFKDSPIVGTYGFMGQRSVVIKDLEIAKHVMIKDFDHFVDRRDFDLGEENKAFKNMLTLLKGEKWKSMRTIMSPVFTSGKLKHFVPLIDKVLK